ncbi:hypothetical protein [Trabulsiella odontotermitis]|uniref:Wzt C-terminal domain-containing protein n=1 Tax=Trabulsiella odontotermitis TaxID=379893 RepID=A0A0L0GGV3_9ENTR|nr:hypothetical protein [Trabulsiella odontotermitis]KNC88275.1 hypothetical protein GM31_11175 [Trabulsiella odontotermitis]
MESINSTIKERISYVIPISYSDDESGLPVLVYEFDDWVGEADISFGIYFIGLRSNKTYITIITVSNNENILIATDSDEFNNRRAFKVGEALDGENIVSASLKVNFNNVKVEKPGIYEVEAALIDGETKKVLNVTRSYFDIKPSGMIRNEFRESR